jgi:hypothetical protein
MNDKLDGYKVAVAFGSCKFHFVIMLTFLLSIHWGIHGLSSSGVPASVFMLIFFLLLSFTFRHP